MNLITKASILASLILTFRSEGHVIRVPEDVPTVQAGLNELQNGDTLLVGVGVYEEALAAPALEFSMVGELIPDSTSLGTIINATQLPIPDSVAILTLPIGARVVVENIAFKNDLRAGIRSDANSVLLRNCVLDSLREGFRQNRSSAVVNFERCSIRFNTFRCVRVFSGSMFYANHCVFSGIGEELFYLVGVGQSVIDSCVFVSYSPSNLLVTSVGSHRISNCTFGPNVTREFESSIYLRQQSLYFANNVISGCYFGDHVLLVDSETDDSVQITGNEFSDCIAMDIGFGGQGVVYVATTGEAEQGALVLDNSFFNCSGNMFADDVSLAPFAPVLVRRNRFERDNWNGVPSIAMSPRPSQPTPAVIDSNVFMACGYAADLSASADARFNYWGHNSGPYHAESNPTGLGDTITGPMQFIPWLTDSADNSEQRETVLPDDYQLTLFPNPFNSSVTIEYALTGEQDVTLEIFDVLGRQVETLLRERQGMGTHSVIWKADALASGLYFARLSSHESALTAKLMLLK